jgi:DNA helicase TIP49 (TBP-interacting protein)
MKAKKMNEQDYLEQYVAEWKERAGGLFGDFTDKFIAIKISQFNLASYKKSLKIRAKMEAIRLEEEASGYDFFADL